MDLRVVDKCSFEYTLDDSGNFDVNVEAVLEHHVHDSESVLTVLFLELFEADTLGCAALITVNLGFFLQRD